MPVTTLSQAQINLNLDQAKALGELARELGPGLSITIEETNIQGALAVITKRGVSMMDAKGKLIPFDKRGA